MRSFILPAAMLAPLFTSCAQPPALDVSGVEYVDSDLLGLTSERREALMDITAFGAATASGTLDAFAEPLVRVGIERRLAGLLRAQLAFDSLEIGEEALRNHYEGLPRVELTVRHLVVLSPRSEPDGARQEARDRASRARERVRAGESFPEVAAEVSEEPGAAERQGLLEPGREGSWVPEFWNAARALEPGGVSPVVETQYGFHVLRLEDRQTVPFDEARSDVTLQVAEMISVPTEGAPPLPAPPDLRMRPEEELTTRVEEPSALDVEPVAEWEGGALTLGDLRDHLAGLERSAYDAVLDPGRAPSLRDVVESVVRVRISANGARARGFTVEAAHEQALRAEWMQAAQSWAAILGFRQGQSRETLKRTSLEALGATGQNASLARGELLARAPLLRRSYRFPSPSDG
jgi:hypothetical protein